MLSMYNFHMVAEEQVVISEYTGNRVASIVSYYSSNQVSWSVQAELDVFKNSCYSLELGYRYFDGGCIRTNNYITDQLVAQNFSSIQVLSWCGRFAAHEIVVSLSIYF